MNHIADDLIGRNEIEGGRVADIELDDAVAFFFKPTGVRKYRTANVVTHVVELGGLLYGLHKQGPLCQEKELRRDARKVWAIQQV